MINQVLVFVYLDIEENVEYEAKEDGPGCAKDMDIKEDNCKTAAAKLGFTGIFEAGSWNHAPPGCVVGHPNDHWAYVYFNAIATGGSLGKPQYKSICKKKEHGMYSISQNNKSL